MLPAMSLLTKIFSKHTVQLRMIDNVMINFQDNGALKRKLPFVEKDVSSMLVEASKWSGRWLGAISDPQSFQDRDKKSLILLAETAVADSDGGVNLSAAVLELYFLKGDLSVNPDNPHAVRELSEVCNLEFKGVPVDDERYAIAIRDAIHTSGCAITACPKRSCFKDLFGDYYACPCDVVVDVNEQGKTFIASVAYVNDGGKYDGLKKDENAADVQLLGLYQASESMEDNTHALGISLNSPVYPELLPKFSNLEELVHLTLDFLATVMEEFGLSVTYVPMGEADASFALELNYTQFLELDVSFDGSFNIGGKIDSILGCLSDHGEHFHTI